MRVRLVLMTCIAFVVASAVTAAPAVAKRPDGQLRSSVPSYTVVDSGKRVVVRGTLAGSRGGESVKLQRWTGSRWVTRRVGEVGKNHRFAVTYRPRLGDHLLRLRVPADATFSTQTSGYFTVEVFPSLSSFNAIPGETVRLSGWLPSKARRAVLLQRLSGRKWHSVARGFSRADGYVAFGVRVFRVGASKGGYRLYAPRSGRLPGFTSDRVFAQGSQEVDLDGPADVPLEEVLWVRARLSPARPGRSVVFQQRDGTGWKTVRTTVQNPEGFADFGVEADEVGRFEFRAIAPTSKAGAEPIVSRSRAVNVVVGPILPPTIASVATDGTQADRSSREPSISADGRRVAFTTQAGNLVPGDVVGTQDVFVRDVDSGTTTRASVSSAGEAANRSVMNPSISADGRLVVFESSATNLVPDDANLKVDVFVRDLVHDTTTLVSAGVSGRPGDGGSSGPEISGDGRFVTFTSSSGDLVPADTNARSDVFVRDLREGATTRVSVADDGTQSDGSSSSPSISADGSRVVFQSTASNLVDENPAGAVDVFVRDLRAGTTTLVSTTRSGGPDEEVAQQPRISANGRFVVYLSSERSPSVNRKGRSDLLVRDLVSGTISQIPLPDHTAERVFDGPDISADGQVVSFALEFTPLDATYGKRSRVYVHDRRAGQTVQADVTRNGHRAPGAALGPDLSADGRSLAFESSAVLAREDVNGTSDVYVRSFDH